MLDSGRYVYCSSQTQLKLEGIGGGSMLYVFLLLQAPSLEPTVL